MTERPVQFGDGEALFGVITRPTQHEPESIACLMLNAGLIHRVGPHRLHVGMARALAECGITALRFDQAGIGDSPHATSGLGYRDQAVHDIRSAMDWLEREYGIRRFLLFGICSGAVNAHWAALADSRVVGLMVFDGFAYRTRRMELVLVWKRVRAMGIGESVIAVKRWLLRVLTRAVTRPTAVNVLATWDLGNPPKADYVAQLRVLVDRGVAVLLVYGGSVMDVYSYKNQYRDGFAGKSLVDHVRYEFYPDLDHTVILLEAQRKLVRLTCDWAMAARGSSGVTAPRHSDASQDTDEEKCR